MALSAAGQLHPVLHRQHAEDGSSDAFGLDQFNLRADEADELYVAVVDDHVNRGIDHRVVGERLVAVNVEDIDIIIASGAYADISARGRRYTMRASLRTLEAELDPERFVRVHRSVIVPIDRIEWFRRLGNGDGEVQTVTGQRAPVSRARRLALEKKLGLR